MVTGTIPLFGNLASTFFDSGATHSFISSTYDKLCSLITQPLDQNITVSTPAGDVVTCRKIAMDCPIVIEGRISLANLAVFHMLGFEISLGMDWLSKYYAQINCRQKEVVFHLPNDVEFKFRGNHVRATPPILLAIQARRCIRNGAPTFLAYIKAESGGEHKLEDIPIVSGYPDVFAKITSCLPPDREIEFTIDLMSGTQPIHKAPYEMAPFEIKGVEDTT